MDSFLSRINHYRTDPSGWLGSVIMLSFGGYAFYRWQVSGLIFFLLLVLRDIAAAWFFLTRNPPQKEKASNLASVLAYVSSGWAFIYLSPTTDKSELFLATSLLAVAGFTLSTLALFDLGKSFGVSPANRGLVRTGVYRYLKHPMYIGYVISESGFVLLNPWNVFFLILSILFYFFRAKIEYSVLRSDSA